MANWTSLKSTKVAKKAAAKRLAAQAASKSAPKTQSGKVAKPALLAGGNPQIAKADGEAPVQAYIEAMPGWKRDVGCRLDEIITMHLPSAMLLSIFDAVRNEKTDIYYQIGKAFLFAKLRRAGQG